MIRKFLNLIPVTYLLIGFHNFFDNIAPRLSASRENIASQRFKLLLYQPVM
jgi:hypothetical protein